MSDEQKNTPDSDPNSDDSNINADLDHISPLKFEPLLHPGYHSITGENASSHCITGSLFHNFDEQPEPIDRTPNWIPSSQKLDSELKYWQLAQELQKKDDEIAELVKNKSDYSKAIDDRNKTISELTESDKCRHLFNSVSDKAQKAIVQDPKLKESFESNQTCNAFVVSIDVRRSTELMLKAKTPQLFAEFIIELARLFRVVILKKYGVFDKFTGDGVLAFFPEFYSGKWAGLLAVEAAHECHDLFEELYRKNRRCFKSVLKDVGLGIGIDFGEVNIVNIKGELTVVGTPVVYACRLGGADAGHTLANQPAYDMLFDQFSSYINTTETEIGFKHEGTMVAYDIKRNEKEHKLDKPEWEKRYDSSQKQQVDEKNEQPTTE